MNHTGTVDQKIIHADTDFNAVVNYLGAKPPGIATLDKLLEWCIDQNIAINFIEIN
jgi:hypothetical protein